MRWRCRERIFDPAERALVMGILNVTPDSFSDGGRYFEPAAAIARGRQILEEGADLIDLGAESTRPGSQPVPAEEQWRRLEPVIAALSQDPRACLSVDTASAEVAQRALGLGVEVINDVTALGDPGMAAVASASGAGVVLMHMRGVPADMHRDPRYDDAAGEIAAWLAERRAVARAAGIEDDRIALDPGVGFGKALEHNLAILARIGEIVALGRPVLVGVSRKSFIGKLLADAPVHERLEGGLAAVAIARFEGAAIVRTHDVAPTRRALEVAEAIRRRRRAGEAANR
jgi:dihydropteroate synthase